MNGPRTINGRLEILNSRLDVNGNRYWAFRFTDFITGREVVATYSGGESNARAMLHGWNPDQPQDWDRSIMVEESELKIREFNRLVKDWPYAGCEPAELRQFVKDRIKAGD